MSLTLRICGVEGGGTQNASMFGLFVLVPSAPVADTTLLDLNMTTSGYIRWVLLATGAIHQQCSLLGQTADQEMVAAGSLPYGTWLWLGGSCGRWTGAPSGDNKAVWGAAYTVGGAQVGSTAQFDTHSTYGLLDYACNVGVGVSLSSSKANFPNQAGWAWSKARVSYTNPSPPWAVMTVLGKPSSDWAGGDGIAYNCRDTTGSHTSLADSISGTVGTAGPVGVTVNSTGPYP